mmetsp:Transcript_28171/g.65104  ORF Transcript_28171/g.65104 Transcript_28171/m.65104 type:complete len:638 (-) Transcript_28171:141-2054(-)
MLALPAPLDGYDGEPSVTCQICLVQRRIEPAGREFHTVHEKPKINAAQTKRKPRTQAKDESDEEMQADEKWKQKRKDGKSGGQKNGSLKLSPLLEGQDLYALLEVTETASVDQIKKQYRKLVLQHHPDKQGAQVEEAVDAGSGLSEKDVHFVRIQEAYEVLSDHNRRQQYDSTLEFDDSIPDEVDSGLDFYQTFGPVFQRNSRWSNRRPVPDLGNKDTDIAKVHKFYDFWLDFDSWRDFSMHDEYNLEEAEFREERRWMDRQNQKGRKKYQDAERKRLVKLVETAERLDPRIRAEKEEKEAKKREEKEKRARQKQAEEEQKRKEEEEKLQREEKERQEREEKERLEKEQRQQQKQVAKGLRQRLKKLAQGQSNSLNAVETQELQDFALALEVEQLEELCLRLEALEPTKVTSSLRGELEKWRRQKAAELEEQSRQREEAKRKGEQKAMEAKEAEKAAKSASWSAEELGVLAKGLQKFPGGISNRWSLITQMLAASGFPRAENEVIEKVKEMSDGQSLRSMGSQISATAGTSTYQAKPKQAAQAEPNSAAMEPPASKAKPAAKAAPAKEELAADAEGSAESWSAEQQKSLEAALQKYPASMDKNERWRLIAEEVPGKSKTQCVARFKHLREQVMKQKG